MKDEMIIHLLHERNENVLSEIAGQYGRLYAGVLRSILKEESDIEECENDVLLSVWNSIPPNHPERLSPYLCAIAKRTAIDRLRYNTRKMRNPGYLVLLSELEDCVPEKESAACVDDGKKLREALDRFLRGQKKEARILFIRRYVYSEPVSSLAVRFGIRENTVSAKLMRTRKKLKRFLEEEGITI